MDIGGAVPIYKLNDRVSFLLVKFEYCRSHECLGFWFEDEEKEEIEAWDGVQVGKLKN